MSQLSPIFRRSAVIDIETGIPLEWDEFVWTGPVAACKKGHEQAGKATDAALSNAATNTGRQTEQYGAENRDITGLETAGSGGLGPASSAYLANSLADIDRNYGNARQAVARVNAQRGFAATPDATFASGVNSANLAQAGASNKAYNDALLLQRENTLAAMNARSGLQGIYDPNRPLSTALSGAEAQSQMGSTLGDIGRGISTGVGLATGIAGLPKAFKNFNGSDSNS